MNDLSPAQRRQLQRLIAKLSNDDDANSSFSFPLNSTLERILDWAQAYEVLQQSPRQGNRVRVVADWLEDINRALLSQGYAALDSRLKGDRIEQAMGSVTENKHLADSPTQHRVLLALRSPQPELAYTEGREPAWQVADTDWRDLDLNHYANLIIVENLTVFYQLDRLNIEWPDRELIVYRGGGRHSASSQLLSSWAALHKPCYGLVDLDPASVRMLQSGPYTHVAAPPLHRFQTLASAAHAQSEQHRYAVNIEPRGEFAAHLQHMLKKQVGLKQEWMHYEPLYWFGLN